MAQLTADKSRKYKLSPDVHTEQPVDAATQIFMNSMVGLNPATNCARQLVGGDSFLGFAFSPAWNIIDPYRPGLTENGVLVGNSAAINVELRVEGVLVLPLAMLGGATAGNAPSLIGAAVYAPDGDTIELGVQTITFTENGTPTGGTVTLASSGTNGTAIAYNANGTQFLAGLPANVASLFSGVTGPASGPWVGTLNPGATPPTITVATNALTGGTSPSVTVGAATASTGLSKIGTIRNYLYGQFEILFKAITEKVS